MMCVFGCALKKRTMVCRTMVCNKEVHVGSALKKHAMMCICDMLLECAFRMCWQGAFDASGM